MFINTNYIIIKIPVDIINTPILFNKNNNVHKMLKILLTFSIRSYFKYR